MKKCFLRTVVVLAAVAGCNAALQAQQPVQAEQPTQGQQPPPTPQSGSAPLVAAQIFTMDNAVNQALRHNLDYLALKYNLSVAEAAIITAKLRPNPILTLDADHLDLLGTGFSTTSANGKMPNNGGPTEYSVRLDQLYERGGKRSARTAFAVDNRDVARLQLADAIRALILSAQDAFIDVQAARDALKLGQENLKTFDDVVSINQIRYKDGDIAQVELLRSQIGQLQAANAVRQAQLQKDSSLSRLQLFLGLTKLQISDVSGELREDMPDPGRDALIAQAMAQRPDLQASIRNEAAARADSRLQKANSKVDWQFGTEYRKQDVTAHADTLGFFMQSQIPLFNRNQGEIARAAQSELQAKARTRALGATVANDVDLALLEYLASREALQQIEGTMLGKARKVKDISEYAYKRGDISFVDFIDAVRAFNDTMQNYNDARAEHARSLYALDAATGSTIAGGKVKLP